MWLHCFLGTITEEISDALIRHVKLVDGIWCFDITTEGRTTIVDGETIGTELKTAFRPRLLPLHPALIGEGFLDRVEDVRRDMVRERRCSRRSSWTSTVSGIRRPATSP